MVLVVLQYAVSPGRKPAQMVAGVNGFRADTLRDPEGREIGRASHLRDTVCSRGCRGRGVKHSSLGRVAIMQYSR